MSIDMIEFQILYENIVKKIRNYCKEKNKLDKMIESKWHFNYSDFNMYRIIDTLDHGEDNVNFIEFCKMMEDQKIINEK